MNEFDIVSVLSQGTIGLSFLLSLLSYKLIRNTQRIKSNNGVNTSRPVYVFMAMTLLFLAVSVYENTVRDESANYEEIRTRLITLCEKFRSNNWLQDNESVRDSLSKECLLNE